MEPGYVLLFGRLHPLILHFPIALLMIAGFMELLSKMNGNKFGQGYSFATWIILCFGALSAIIAASMGFTLAASGAYDGDTIYWHKRYGLAVAALSLFAILLKYYSEQKETKVLARLYSINLILCIGAIMMAGHYGGALTHGSDFLPDAAPEPIASWLREDEGRMIKTSLNDQYTMQIEPILDEYCVSCHGDSKQEGGLRFDDLENVLSGGESGLAAIVPGQALSSEMIRRLFLIRNDKKAMPPEGRVRPNDSELVTIMDWIEAGAPWSSESVGPSVLMVDHLNAQGIERVSDQALRALEAAGVTYFPMSENNALLNVDLSLKQYDIEVIETLLIGVSGQIAWLNLADNKLNEELIGIIAEFPNLTKLSLARTGIDDQAVGHLSQSETLTSLNLIGNPVTESVIIDFKNTPNLNTLYVWDTEIRNDQIPALREELKDVDIITGSELKTLVVVEE